MDARAWRNRLGVAGPVAGVGVLIVLGRSDLISVSKQAASCSRLRDGPGRCRRPCYLRAFRLHRRAAVRADRGVRGRFGPWLGFWYSMPAGRLRVTCSTPAASPARTFSALGGSAVNRMSRSSAAMTFSPAWIVRNVPVAPAIVFTWPSASACEFLALHGGAEHRVDSKTAIVALLGQSVKSAMAEPS